MGNKYPNRIVVNVKSPKNERDYIEAYKQLNPKANKPDGKDIAAVKTPNGEYGHVLLNENVNRSKDKNPHRGESFISNDELRKQMKK